ncbi:GTP-binding protein [Mycena pura]|uniref:GTP-binding protein n=1 Tax=Mycena pura TaxID=153505 RepID=A0AAD6YUS6_9AGAR|nr:GTP-binding protein [Mycena pura]
MTLDSAIDVRSKCKCFRVLVIGRANAGKTTLLKKVCRSVEDPEIWSPSGEKIDASVVEGSDERFQRGIHDIENQLIFKSNPQFVFHDSRGFESGSVDEVDNVKTFIAERAASHELSEQLHAIWYCMPTDTNRPSLKADEDFFDTDMKGNGKAFPVIVVFTKYDGLVIEAESQLVAEGRDEKEAEDEAPNRARAILASHFRAPLKRAKYPPSEHVVLADMDQESSDCNELIEKTANALTDDALRLLFVSVQQNNIDLCTYFAMKFLAQLSAQKYVSGPCPQQKENAADPQQILVRP